jgi:hypothetical protein
VHANATVVFELSSVATAAPLPFVRLGASRASQSVLGEYTRALLSLEFFIGFDRLLGLTDYATGAVLTGPERVVRSQAICLRW